MIPKKGIYTGKGHYTLIIYKLDTCHGSSAERKVKQRQSFCINKKNGELMKQYSLLWLCILAVAMMLTSCEVIGDIFQAGIWVGIILVVAVVLLIIWLVGRFRR